MIDWMAKEKRFKLSKYELISITKQLLVLLSQLDQLRIVHSDIKLDNLVVTGKAHDIVLKLIDFGYAFTGNRVYQSGTMNYIAPEIVCEDFPDQAHLTDVWSIGVIIHRLWVKEWIIDIDKNKFTDRCDSAIRNTLEQFESESES